MADENIYQSPNSELGNLTTESGIIEARKQLVPKWIKVFGWLFIIFGILVPIIGIFAAVSGATSGFSLYGLETTGSVFSPKAILIMALFIAHGACAFGLLFGKPWGVISCIILAYISSAICVYSMVMGNGSTVRLELLVLIPYLVKLHKLMPAWASGKNI